METVSLEKYPAMKKAIELTNLSKSLEFSKSGVVIKQAIMIKIGQCQADLNQMLVDHKANRPVKSRYDTDMNYDASEAETAPATASSEPEKEPWKIRDKRQEIDDLNRIYRNLNDKKNYSLSQYDIKTYGL